MPHIIAEEALDGETHGFDAADAAGADGAHGAHGADGAIVDPLAPDDVSDPLVLTTRRAIARVALAATLCGSRFTREGIEQDPMVWMLSPRGTFDGQAPLDACLTRDACERAVLVHGLGLGLDVERGAVDFLMSGDGDDADPSEFLDHHGFRHNYERIDAYRRRARMPARLRLFTATIARTQGNTMIQAFHASIARSPGEIVRRLTERFGEELALCADVRVGLHPASPLVVALVPVGVAEVIRRIELGRNMSGNATFAVDIQQFISA